MRKAILVISGYIFLLLLIKVARADKVRDFLNAAYAGDIVKVKALLQKDPKLINAEDKHGLTALILALFHNNKDVVKFLITSGIDVNAKNHYGQTALIAVAGLKGTSKSDLNESTEFLITRGADVNAKDNEGRTALMNATRIGKRNMIDRLIEKGADVNAIDHHKRTPLHYAVEFQQKEIVVSLISKGADFETKNDEGLTPLKLAKKHKYNDIADLLREHGAKE